MTTRLCFKNLAQALLTVFLATYPEWALGQGKKRDQRVEIPSPEAVVLETGDGVTIKGNFYGSAAGKQAVPILVVHDFKENRRSYDKLATFLQAEGHAVLTLDLRGHGESTSLRLPNGRDRTLGPKDLRKPDFIRMYSIDGELERAKQYLLEKHHTGELNIEKLCVIGVGMGSMITVNWAALDWSRPVLVTGKQGQDTRALVLISPEWSFQGIAVREALEHPLLRSQVSFLLVAGNKGKQVAASRQIHQALKPFHPDPLPEEAAEKKDLFLHELDSSLSGGQLLDPALGVSRLIADFIRFRLIQRDIPWTERFRLPTAQRSPSG